MSYTEEQVVKKGTFQKGHRINNGRTPWNKGKKCPQLADAQNGHWKGNEVGYSALHSWVRKNKGKPQNCTTCGTTQNVQWANLDHKYARVLEDYAAFCTKCHHAYDREHNGYTR